MSDRIKVYSGETLDRLPRFPHAYGLRGGSDIDALFPVRVLQVLGLTPGGALPLTVVSTDATLTGSGTVASPLSVVAVGGTIPGTGKTILSANTNQNGFTSGATLTLNNPAVFDSGGTHSFGIVAASMLIGLVTPTAISASASGTAPANWTAITGSAPLGNQDAFCGFALDTPGLQLQTISTAAFGYSTASFIQGGLMAIAGVTTAPVAGNFAKISTSTGQTNITVPAPASPGTASSLVLVWGSGGTGANGFPSNGPVYTLWSTSSNKYSAGFYKGPAVAVDFTFSGSNQNAVAAQLVIP